MIIFSLLVAAFIYWEVHLFKRIKNARKLKKRVFAGKISKREAMRQYNQFYKGLNPQTRTIVMLAINNLD